MTNDEAMGDGPMAEAGMAGEDPSAGEEMAGSTVTDETMGAGEQEASADEMADEGMSEEAMTEGEMGAETMTGEGLSAEPMPEALPAWQQLPLVNARSGETFTLADFTGQRVFVEPMATWCTNCRRQLENVLAARAMAPEDAVFVALSVETSLPAGELAGYAEAAGFDWIFAVITPEMLQALVEAFGRPVGNPPSTPHFLIAADGSWTELVTGIDDPETLLARIEELE